MTWQIDPRSQCELLAFISPTLKQWHSIEKHLETTASRNLSGFLNGAIVPPLSFFLMLLSVGRVIKKIGKEKSTPVGLFSV